MSYCVRKKLKPIAFGSLFLIGMISNMNNAMASYVPSERTRQNETDEQEIEQSEFAAVIISPLEIEIEEINNHPVELQLFNSLDLPGLPRRIQDGSIVRASLVKDGSNIVLKADAVIDEFGSIKIEASSRRVHTQTKTEGSRLAGGWISGLQAESLADDLSGAIGTSEETNSRIQKGANVFGSLIGIASSQKKKEYVYMEPGEVYIFTLAPLRTSAETEFLRSFEPSQNNSNLIGNESEQLEIKSRNGFYDSQEVDLSLTVDVNDFNFRNNLQYTEFLEDIVEAYKEERIPYEQARTLIVEADIFVSRELDRGLIPPAGVRRQIKELFDYIYEIDA